MNHSQKQQFAQLNYYLLFALTVFHCFPPFYAQERIALVAFAQLLFFKEWRERFALIALYKRAT